LKTSNHLLKKKTIFAALNCAQMLENFSFQNLKEQFNSNKNVKLLTFAVGGVLLVVVGYFAYRQFLWNPDNEKSKDAYWVGLNYAAKDSTDLAIDELQGTVKKYDGKIGGENAQFVLARQYMAKGEFKKTCTIKLANSHGTNKHLTLPSYYADYLMFVSESGAILFDKNTLQSHIDPQGDGIIGIVPPHKGTMIVDNTVMTGDNQLEVDFIKQLDKSLEQYASNIL
jgi:hypothetical protein